MKTVVLDEDLEDLGEEPTAAPLETVLEGAIRGQRAARQPVGELNLRLPGEPGFAESAKAYYNALRPEMFPGEDFGAGDLEYDFSGMGPIRRTLAPLVAGALGSLPATVVSGAQDIMTWPRRMVESALLGDPERAKLWYQTEQLQRHAGAMKLATSGTVAAQRLQFVGEMGADAFPVTKAISVPVKAAQWGMRTLKARRFVGPLAQGAPPLTRMERVVGALSGGAGMAGYAKGREVAQDREPGWGPYIEGAAVAGIPLAGAALVSAAKPVAAHQLFQRFRTAASLGRRGLGREVTTVSQYEATTRMLERGRGAATDNLVRHNEGLQRALRSQEFANDIQAEIQGGMAPVLLTPRGARRFVGLIEGAPRRVARARFSYDEANRRLAQATNSAERWAEHIDSLTPEELASHTWLSETPVNFDHFSGWIRKFIQKNFYSPEGIAAKMGAAGGMLIRRIDNALISHWGEVTALAGRLEETRTRVWQAMGGQGAPKDGYFFAEAADVWQRGGPGALTAWSNRHGYDTFTLVGAATELDNLFRSAYAPLRELGGERWVDLQAMGLQRYWPQVVRGNQRDYIDATARAWNGRDPTVSIENAALQLRAAFAYRNGIRRFGTIDHQRWVPGTIRDKVAQGIPIVDDPFEAAYIHLGEVSARTHISGVVGFRGELLNPMLELAAREGADAAPKEGLLTQIAEGMLGMKYHEGYGQRLAQVLLSTQTAARMAYSAIPNFGQPFANNPVAMGWNNTVRGWVQAVRGDPIAFNMSRLNQVAAIHQHLFDTEIRAGLLNAGRVGGAAPEHWSDRALSGFERGTRGAAEFVLHHGQFGLGESIARASSAAGAYMTIQETLGKAALGRLRGNNWSVADRAMKDVGVNLAASARRMREGAQGLTDDEMFRAVFRMMRRTQFIPTAANRPISWQTPIGRVWSQFNHFAFNQGRLMRDRVVAEAALGNYEPLAFAFGVQPVIGGGISLLLDSIKGRANDPMFGSSPAGMALDAWAHVGALGLMQSAIYGTIFNKGVVGFLGPTAGMAEDILQGAYHIIMEADPDPLITDFLNYPTSKAVQALWDVGNAVGPKIMDAVEFLTVLGGGDKGEEY